MSPSAVERIQLEQRPNPKVSRPSFDVPTAGQWRNAAEGRCAVSANASHPSPAFLPEDKPWLSIGEVAQLLGVSKKTVQRLPIPRTRLGRLPRFSRQVVEKFMAGRQEVPVQVDLAALAVAGHPNLSQPIPPRRSARKLDRGLRAAHLLKLMEGKGG